MISLKETNFDTIKKLYQIMYDTHQIFKKNGVKYWADGGTLLGAVRHKGVIPWDDDLDIGILSKDISKFLNLEKQFSRCGYSICKVWFGYKIYFTNKKKVKNNGEPQCYSFPFIDVLPYNKFPDGIYRLSLKEARDMWPKEVWKEKDLFPIVEYAFGDFNIAGPNSYKNYFDNYYGKDWNEVAYREYDHEQEKRIESIKVKLTNNMRKSAYPNNTTDKSILDILYNKHRDVYYIEKNLVYFPINIFFLFLFFFLLFLWVKTKKLKRILY